MIAEVHQVLLFFGRSLQLRCNFSKTRNFSRIPKLRAATFPTPGVQRFFRMDIHAGGNARAEQEQLEHELAVLRAAEGCTGVGESEYTGELLNKMDMCMCVLLRPVVVQR